jgi:hypothetical protein
VHAFGCRGGKRSRREGLATGFTAYMYADGHPDP